MMRNTSSGRMSRHVCLYNDQALVLDIAVVARSAALGGDDYEVNNAAAGKVKTRVKVSRNSVLIQEKYLKCYRKYIFLRGVVMLVFL